MAAIQKLFANNVSVLRGRARRYAYVGLGVGMLAVILATALDAVLQTGELTLETMLAAQRNNLALWLLDCMPLAFAFWGQYVSVIVAHEAGALVIDQTQELRDRNTALKVQAGQASGFDKLTGLPDRSRFLDQVQEDIEQANSEGRSLGVVIVDLDGFKEVNEMLGQDSGDIVLKTAGRRMRGVVPEQSTVARLAADMFAVLVPGAASREDLDDIAGRINKALQSPCMVRDTEICLHASSGGALGNDDSMDAAELLNCASTAMHEAKRIGNHFLLFKPAGQAVDPQMLSLTAELRTAIEREEFVLFLQPIVDSDGKEVLGAEALVRWQHPRRGLLPPSEFIARAERSGLIVQLSAWVLRRALRHARDLARAGNPMRISVNLSARSLRDNEFPAMLERLLAAFEVPGERLLLEITEDTLMTDHQRSLEVVERVAELGVRISIDDFGTGYSQLAYLKRLPVSEIKIDRSFVKDMLECATDLSIVQTTIGLAKALSLHVVGEGVETEAQRRCLADMGCDLLQGYYFSRAMPADAFQAWLEHWREGSYGQHLVSRPHPAS